MPGVACKLGCMGPENLEPRVDAGGNEVCDLTGRVHASEHDAAAAPVLGGGAGRDVSEFRSEILDFRQAMVASSNAMREDFVDLRRQFAALRQHLDSKFEQVDQGFVEMRGRFDAAAAGQRQIVDILHGMIRGQGGSTPAG